MLKIFSFSTCNYADQIKQVIQRTPTGRLTIFRERETQLIFYIFRSFDPLAIAQKTDHDTGAPLPTICE